MQQAVTETANQLIMYLSMRKMAPDNNKSQMKIENGMFHTKSFRNTKNTILITYICMQTSKWILTEKGPM